MLFLFTQFYCTYFLETGNGNIYVSSNNTFTYVFNKDDVQDLQEQKPLNPPDEHTQLELATESEPQNLCSTNMETKIQWPKNTSKPLFNNFSIDKNGFIHIKNDKTTFNLNISIFDVMNKPKIVNGVVFCVSKYVKLQYTVDKTIIFVIKLVLSISSGDQSRNLYYNYIYSPYEGKANVDIEDLIIMINNEYFDIENVEDAIVNVYALESVGKNNFFKLIHQCKNNVMVEKKRWRKSPLIIIFMFCVTSFVLFYKGSKKSLIVIRGKIEEKKGYTCYNGFFNGSAAMIKVYKSDDERYKNEITIMNTLQRQNVVKYYYMEVCENEIRLVFEQTKILDRNLTKQETYSIVTLIYEMHEKGIVYNNLSIENVRLNNHGQIVLVNFEDAHIINGNTSVNEKHDLGVENWRCTDVILHNRKMYTLRNEALLKVDVFSLGILLYYTEKMKNPFDNATERIEQNIVTNQYTLEYIYDHSLHDLICHCLKIKHNDRIPIQEVYVHPYFWSTEKKFNFLANLSDIVESKKESSKRVFVRLEKNKHKIYQGSWTRYLDGVIIDELKNYRGYNEKLVKGLLRAIRNKGRHFKELPVEIKAIYRNFPDGYMNYYIRKYPSLLMVCHYSARCIADDESLNAFYEFK